MTEQDYLQNYDPKAFARPSVAVDLVLLSVVEGQLCALLQLRDQHPHKGKWALPGGFVGIEEGLEAAARRILAAKAKVAHAYLEQLYTFGAIDRDPRMRVISVAYYALMPAEQFAAAVQANKELARAQIVVPNAATGAYGSAHAYDADGAAQMLAFDHADILGHAVHRLRGKLDYAPIAFALLPELFTLRQLQDIHEAILNAKLNKPAFRRRMLDRGWIIGTAKREAGTSFRPAELYRRKSKSV
jgi:8-oxo-dGTP diphosphatase